MILGITGSSYYAAEFEKRTDTSVEASLFNENGYVPSSATPGYENEEEIMLVPVGTAFGIKLYTDGVIVTGLASFNTENGTFSPAKDAGIKEGDYILEAEGQKIENNETLSGVISASGKEIINLKVRRGDETFMTELHLVSDGQYLRGGMWIRDSAAGIGTLTYYNPATKEFAGLGHGICDVDTKTIMNVKDGEPAEITITSIQEGEKNRPGRLNGYFTGSDPIGRLKVNNEAGIFGTLDYVPEGTPIPMAKCDEVVTGEAQIIATIDETGPKSYSVFIESICKNRDQPTKNMVICVTDPELLNKTGGIVQGMSGCPIIQNGKLIGAVTHVFIDNPKMGYGIFAESMIKHAS